MFLVESLIHGLIGVLDSTVIFFPCSTGELHIHSHYLLLVKINLVP
jgi:hypothetical protein